MMKRAIGLWIFLLSLLVCPLVPLQAVAAPVVAESRRAFSQESALQEGIELYAAGETRAALLRLRAFIDRYPDSLLLPQAHFHLARIYYEMDRPQDALYYLDRIPSSKQGVEMHLLRGLALVKSGEVEKGIALLQASDAEHLPGDFQKMRLAALAEGALRQERPLQALALLYQSYSLPSADDTGEAMLRQGHEILADKLTDRELAEAAFMFRGTVFGADAVLEQARRAKARGNEAAALGLVEMVLEKPAPFLYRDEAIELWQRLTGEVWLRRSIGVLLPQSGRFSAFGALVRRGMELAAEIHDRHHPPVRFLFRDSGTEPAAAAAAVSELVHRDRVMAIAGPLTGDAAFAAAEQAQLERVPLLTLSPRENLPLVGDFVFRNSLTSRLQAETLARYAVTERGMTGFGVLYPDNKLGRELTELFAAEVLKRGGLVVARQGYPEDATDFGRQIKLLKGEDPDASGTAEEPGEEAADGGPQKAFPPVDFDALFIPDYADRVGLIAPQLAYHGIEGLPLLGINGWNSSELTSLAGRYVEGAVFVDGFFRYSPYPFVQDFINRYFEKYGEEPTILEAQGFDVANILLSQLDSTDIDSREDLRLALSQLKNYPGVTGGTTFNLQGDAEKVLFILQVQNGNIVQVN